MSMSCQLIRVAWREIAVEHPRMAACASSKPATEIRRDPFLTEVNAPPMRAA
jgi:hypothetical protein